MEKIQLTFHGESDDIRMIYSGEDEILDVSGWVENFERKVTITRGDEGFCVVYHYDGCWSMSVGQLDEDIPIPDWLKLVKVEMGNLGYSADLTIEVPEDVKLDVYRGELRSRLSSVVVIDRREKE